MSAAACRCCNSPDLREVIDFGLMPLADRLIPTGLSHVVSEPRYPLKLVFCENCALVQLTHPVASNELFADNYPYYSSFSPQLLEHAREHVASLMRQRDLDGSSFVVEVASNDGYLLRNFVERDIPVLGIDPAEGPAAAAQQNNVPTLCGFFNIDTARAIAGTRSKADVIIANNVFAHVDSQRDFVMAIATLLKPDGVVSIEVPYLRDLIANCEFDTIYHEHFCYFSITSVIPLLASGGLYLNDVRRHPIHGGSLRLSVSFADRMRPTVERLLAEEHDLGIDRFDFYRNFGDRVVTLKECLLNLLRQLRGEGNRIAAYGAAAKGATLINYCGIGPDLIEYVVDRNFHKHGMSMPGQHIPIVPAERLLRDRPDYVLILAWNFAEEIVEQQAEYRDAGGRFIVPIPDVRVI